MPPRQPWMREEEEEKEGMVVSLKTKVGLNKKANYHRSFSEGVICKRFGVDVSRIRRGDVSCDYVSMEAMQEWWNMCGFRSTTIVVVPSLDLDRSELLRMSRSIEFYEERQLYNLLMLENPQVEVIFVSSECVSSRVVGYYLSLSESVSKADMFDRLSRLHMFSPHDGSPVSLSDKVLSRPGLMRLIREALDGRPSTCRLVHRLGLSVFTPSPNSDLLSKRLCVKLLEGCNNDLYWGTKQGSREAFRKCGVPFPAGTPAEGDDDLLQDMDGVYGSKGRSCIRSPENLALGLARQLLRGVNPHLWVVKLNNGFSGKGNAILDLTQLQPNHYQHPKALAQQIQALFPTMTFQDPNRKWSGPDGYQNQIQTLGVIAEAFLQAQLTSSPSAQIVIDNGNKVHILSTHEQLLHGHIYYGCRNPASQLYRQQLLTYTKRIATYLAANGVTGHFSVDFLATKQNTQWTLHAIEINLRQGGTTHPYSLMALLCKGETDSQGVFRLKDGQPRCYIATDLFQDTNLKGMDEDHFIDTLKSATVHWNPFLKKGSVFHLFRFLKTHGRIGFTSIAETEEEATQLYKDTEAFLKELGRKRLHE